MSHRFLTGAIGCKCVAVSPYQRTTTLVWGQNISTLPCLCIINSCSMPSATGLCDLPPDTLLCLLNHVVVISNTGQVLKLAAASQQCLALVAHSDWFWQQQSDTVGWLRSGVLHPPHAQRPGAQCRATAALRRVNATASTVHNSGSSATAPSEQYTPAVETPTLPHPAGGQPSHTAGAGAVSRLWFEYYCLRMSCRWRLRLLVRKYIPFLNIQSKLAMQAGASIQELEAAEAQLGLRLPWELWELYRFRAGQAPGPGVSFADACRLLGPHELSVVSIALSSTPSLAPDGPRTQQQQLAAVEAQLPLLSCQAQQQHTRAAVPPSACSPALHIHATNYSGANQQQSQSYPPAQQQPGPRLDSSLAGSCSNSVSCCGGAAAGSGPQLGRASADVCAVVFLSNAMGSMEYAVAPDSAVYLKRGFTHRRVTHNLSGFIQHLLS